MNNIKGSLILLLVAFIWGTAFVAQTSGAGAVGTFTFNAARSIVGALFLAVVIIIKNVVFSHSVLKDTYNDTISKYEYEIIIFNDFI